MKNCLSKALTVIFAFTSYSSASAIYYGVEGDITVFKPQTKRLEIQGNTSQTTVHLQFGVEDEIGSLRIVQVNENLPGAQGAIDQNATVNNLLAGFLKGLDNNVNIGYSSRKSNQYIHEDINQHPYEINLSNNQHNINNAGYVRASDKQTYTNDTYMFAKGAAVQFEPGDIRVKSGQAVSAHSSQNLAARAAAVPGQYYISSMRMSPWNDLARHVPVNGSINFVDNKIDFKFQGGKMILESKLHSFEG